MYRSPPQVVIAKDCVISMDNKSYHSLVDANTDNANERIKSSRATSRIPPSSLSSSIQTNSSSSPIDIIDDCTYVSDYNTEDDSIEQLLNENESDSDIEDAFEKENNALARGCLISATLPQTQGYNTLSKKRKSYSDTESDDNVIENQKMPNRKRVMFSREDTIEDDDPKEIPEDIYERAMGVLEEDDSSGSDSESLSMRSTDDSIDDILENLTTETYSADVTLPRVFSLRRERYLNMEIDSSKENDEKERLDKVAASSKQTLSVYKGFTVYETVKMTSIVRGQKSPVKSPEIGFEFVQPHEETKADSDVDTSVFNKDQNSTDSKTGSNHVIYDFVTRNENRDNISNSYERPPLPSKKVDLSHEIEQEAFKYFDVPPSYESIYREPSPEIFFEKAVENLSDDEEVSSIDWDTHTDDDDEDDHIDRNADEKRASKSHTSSIECIGEDRTVSVASLDFKEDGSEKSFSSSVQTSDSDGSAFSRDEEDYQQPFSEIINETKMLTKSIMSAFASMTQRENSLTFSDLLDSTVSESEVDCSVVSSGDWDSTTPTTAERTDMGSFSRGESVSSYNSSKQQVSPMFEHRTTSSEHSAGCSSYGSYDTTYQEDTLSAPRYFITEQQSPGIVQSEAVIFNSKASSSPNLQSVNEQQTLTKESSISATYTTETEAESETKHVEDSLTENWSMKAGSLPRLHNRLEVKTHSESNEQQQKNSVLLSSNVRPLSPANIKKIRLVSLPNHDYEHVSNRNDDKHDQVTVILGSSTDEDTVDDVVSTETKQHVYSETPQYLPVMAPSYEITKTTKATANNEAVSMQIHERRQKSQHRIQPIKIPDLLDQASIVNNKHLVMSPTVKEAIYYEDYIASVSTSESETVPREVVVHTNEENEVKPILSHVPSDPAISVHVNHMKLVKVEPISIINGEMNERSKSDDEDEPLSPVDLIFSTISHESLNFSSSDDDKTRLKVAARVKASQYHSSENILLTSETKVARAEVAQESKWEGESLPIKEAHVLHKPESDDEDTSSSIESLLMHISADPDDFELADILSDSEDSEEPPDEPPDVPPRRSSDKVPDIPLGRLEEQSEPPNVPPRRFEDSLRKKEDRPPEIPPRRSLHGDKPPDVPPRRLKSMDEEEPQVVPARRNFSSSTSTTETSLHFYINDGNNDMDKNSHSAYKYIEVEDEDKCLVDAVTNSSSSVPAEEVIQPLPMEVEITHVTDVITHSKTVQIETKEYEETKVHTFSQESEKCTKPNEETPVLVEKPTQLFDISRREHSSLDVQVHAAVKAEDESDAEVSSPDAFVRSPSSEAIRIPGYTSDEYLGSAETVIFQPSPARENFDIVAVLSKENLSSEFKDRSQSTIKTSSQVDDSSSSSSDEVSPDEEEVCYQMTLVNKADEVTNSEEAVSDTESVQTVEDVIVKPTAVEQEQNTKVCEETNITQVIVEAKEQTAQEVSESALQFESKPYESSEECIYKPSPLYSSISMDPDAKTCNEKKISAYATEVEEQTVVELSETTEQFTLDVTEPDEGTSQTDSMTEHPLVEVTKTWKHEQKNFTPTVLSTAHIQVDQVSNESVVEYEPEDKTDGVLHDPEPQERSLPALSDPVSKYVKPQSTEIKDTILYKVPSLTEMSKSAIMLPLIAKTDKKRTVVKPRPIQLDEPQPIISEHEVKTPPPVLPKTFQVKKTSRIPTIVPLSPKKKTPPKVPPKPSPGELKFSRRTTLDLKQVSSPLIERISSSKDNPTKINKAEAVEVCEVRVVPDKLKEVHQEQVLINLKEVKPEPVIGKEKDSDNVLSKPTTDNDDEKYDKTIKRIEKHVKQMGNVSIEKKSTQKNLCKKSSIDTCASCTAEGEVVSEEVTTKEMTLVFVWPKGCKPKNLDNDSIYRELFSRKVTRISDYTDKDKKENQKKRKQICSKDHGPEELL